jgi:dihydropteroate synthase
MTGNAVTGFSPTVSAPLIMGILNVTPDSFSDGGRWNTTDQALAHAMEMLENGADIIDIGGESTRPGAEPVSLSEEEARVIPVIRAIMARTQANISIDTSKSGVARLALDAGARIINDISAMTADPEMISAAANYGCGVILMHMQGRPHTMQIDPKYADVVTEVRDYLGARADNAIEKGVSRTSLAVDPGIGFGKILEHNVRLLRNLKSICDLGMPVVVGLSRKSFLGKLTGRNTEDRMAASLAGAVWCALHGAAVLRVHDVKETVDALRMAAKLEGWSE